MTTKGRPKIDNPKNKVLITRATPDDLNAIRRGAELAGLTVSDFTRLTALESARALISSLDDGNTR